MPLPALPDPDLPRAPWRGLALPAIATTYLAFTLDSARAEWAGKGGLWKGEPLSRE